MKKKKITDMSGEYAIPPTGQWCLQCAGIIDGQMAGWELADGAVRKSLRERGYIQDTPAPAVYHLNGMVASLAVSEIHNLIYPYKAPQKYLTYDGIKRELLSLDVQLKPDCPVCSADGGCLGLGDLEPLPDYGARERAIPFPEQFDSKQSENEQAQINPVPESLQDDFQNSSFPGGGQS